MGVVMPIYLDRNDKNFEEVLKRITQVPHECRVKKYEDEGFAKVKIRTRRYLYTIKVNINELEEFLKKINCSNVVEF